jgi:hypothetical protein
MSASAKEIRRIAGMRGDARLYELSRPLEGHRYVIVSATCAYSGPETYIFPARKDATDCKGIKSWGDLNGSYRGGLNHGQALRNAGYKVTP